MTDATFNDTEAKPDLNKMSTSDFMAHLDSIGEKNPESASMTGGAIAVVSGYSALVIAPQIMIPISIMWTLYSMGSKTQKSLLKRWSTT